MQHRREIDCVTRFLASKKFPDMFRQNVIQVVQQRHRELQDIEDYVLRLLPPPCKVSVMMCLAQDLIQRCNLFQGCTQAFARALCSFLGLRRYAAKDIVFRSPELPIEGYLVLSGTLAIGYVNDEELFVEEKRHTKSHLGISNMVLLQRFNKTARCVTGCELLAVKRTDLLSLMEWFPEHKDRLFKIASKSLI
eukprot:TRINITY_DN6087_c0_g1_i1.p1 TRINITY_DN6087_c0_g1~~TRINITY_DN6087_c0_g1_i1.p1  ORF type:complete len:193 (-),score=27.99 TRINITY_DN6087_c0_g1_i1:108-686(-)